jgi:hypothetical protein
MHEQIIKGMYGTNFSLNPAWAGQIRGHIKNYASNAKDLALVFMYQAWPRCKLFHLIVLFIMLLMPHSMGQKGSLGMQ